MVDCEDDDNNDSSGAIDNKDSCEDDDTHDPHGAILELVTNNKVDCEDGDNHDSPDAIITLLTTNKNKDDRENERSSVSKHPPA